MVWDRRYALNGDIVYYLRRDTIIMKKLPYEIPDFELALVEEDINTMAIESFEDGETMPLPDIDW